MGCQSLLCPGPPIAARPKGRAKLVPMPWHPSHLSGSNGVRSAPATQGALHTPRCQSNADRLVRRAAARSRPPPPPPPSLPNEPRSWLRGPAAFSKQAPLLPRATGACQPAPPKAGAPHGCMYLESQTATRAQTHTKLALSRNSSAPKDNAKDGQASKHARARGERGSRDDEWIALKCVKRAASRGLVDCAGPLDDPVHRRWHRRPRAYPPGSTWRAPGPSHSVHPPRSVQNAPTFAQPGATRGILMPHLPENTLLGTDLEHVWLSWLRFV